MFELELPIARLYSPPPMSQIAKAQLERWYGGEYISDRPLLLPLDSDCMRCGASTLSARSVLKKIPRCRSWRLNSSLWEFRSFAEIPDR